MRPSKHKAGLDAGWSFCGRGPLLLELELELEHTHSLARQRMQSSEDSRSLREPTDGEVVEFPEVRATGERMR